VIYFERICSRNVWNDSVSISTVCLLYIHDHLINAIGSQHRPQHLNHSPLIFVRHSWLCTQLVQALRIISLRFLHTSSCGVPQDFVLLFIMYITPLNTLISSLSLDNHLYADILSSSSLSTHSTLAQGFLTFKTLFNRYPTGWLLIVFLLTPLRLNSCSSDSKTNLPKYSTLQLSPPTLLEILASYIYLWRTSYLLWSNYISLQSLLLSHSLYPALPRIDSSTACTIATSIVHSKLEHCISLYLKF